MPATSFNHVSVHARSLEESIAFYTGLFGMERLPSPTFSVPTAWLRVGDQELHLFERETSSPAFHHFALNVDDFEAVYVRAQELSVRDLESWAPCTYVLPDGAVQFFVRDPAGNIVEIDWPDVTTLDPSVVTDLRQLADDVAQSEEAARATLYLPREPAS